MAKSRIYPPADRTKQWWETKFDRVTMPGIDKLLLHTTESGKSWPSYTNDGVSGSNAPTLTYNPWVAAKDRWRQHNFLNRSARALRDSANTTVRENRDSVVQVEIVAYCDPKSYKVHGYSVHDMPADAWEDLGELLAFLHKEWGVPIVAAGEWLTYPASGRADSPIRMSGPEYDRFRGMLGHQHASGNTHGDPGITNAEVDRMITVAKRLTAKPTTTPPPVGDDDMELTDTLGMNDYQGRPLTVAQALREAHAVFEMLREGGALNAQLDRIEADTDDGTAGKA
ncbi:hypothetical protein [Kribbella deserti]|uniref:N-acetylmuramoyl-L-alanine amidase n=1 Tax=Kribbella deserti TaxID=1926257 RepID=A0ABV6QH68_9ACTN